MSVRTKLSQENLSKMKNCGRTWGKLPSEALPLGQIKKYFRSVKTQWTNAERKMSRFSVIGSCQKLNPPPRKIDTNLQTPEQTWGYKSCLLLFGGKAKILVSILLWRKCCFENMNAANHYSSKALNFIHLKFSNY